MGRQNQMPPRRSRKNYSLWLMPAGSAFRRLAGVIHDLSRKYSTPPFEPHVTLLGRIALPEREVLVKSAILVRRLRPLAIRLTVLDDRAEYFRCLFVNAAKTAPLIEAHRMARETFHQKQRSAYLPHLSLVYGNLTPRLKKEIITSLGRRFELEFDVRSLYVYSTTGAPRVWRRIRFFRLK